MTRQNFYNELYQIRPYFFGIEEQKAFAEVDGDHKHSSSDAENLYHDDYHMDGEFHVHMHAYPAEVSLYLVIYFQAVIQVYFIAVLVYFFIFCCVKPRIDNSLR